MMKLAIVDDILPNALLIKGMVKRLEDVEALVFTDPRQALHWCKEHDPDLILLDYQMPEMNGVSFLKELRREERLVDIPVVIITGEESKEVLYRALGAGATDFLRKPIDDVELIARIRNMLRLRSRQLDLAEANERLRVLANTDALTGLASRRFFLESFEIEFRRSRRYRHPLSVAMIDVDHFKRVNDTYGHDVGDKVLQSLAKILLRELRIVDRVGRLGGEEFVVCLPETDLKAAKTVCDRLLASVRGEHVNAGSERIQFTISIGLTEMSPDMGNPQSLVKRADDLLYEAKQAGRNRIEMQASRSGGRGGDGHGAVPRLISAKAGRID